MKTRVHTLGEAAPSFSAFAQQEDPQGSVFGAAWRQSNELSSLWNAWQGNQLSLPADPEFRAIEVMDEANPLHDRHRVRLLEARSQEHFDWIEARLQREEEERRLLAANPVGGFLASGLAGVISPTSLVPLTLGARGLKAAGQAALLSSGAVGVQEAVLFSTQEMRSLGEVGVNVGASALFGALLGGIARGRLPADSLPFEQSHVAGRMRIERFDEDGRPISEDIDTIEQSILPDALDEAPAGTRATVYAVDGTPVLAVRNEDGTWRVNGADFELGGNFHRLPVQSPDFPIGGVPVREIVPLEMTEGLIRYALRDRVGDPELVAQLNAVLIERARRGEPAELGGLSPTPLGRVVEDTEVFVPGGSAGAARAANDPGTIQRSQTRLGRAQRELRERIEQSEFGGQSSVARVLRGTAARIVSPDVIGLLARLNPNTRSLDSRFAALREVAATLQVPGIKLEGLQNRGEAATTDGEIMARIQVHQARIVEFLQEFDAAYAEHLYGPTPPRYMPQLMSQIRSGLGQIPEGKMSYREFSEATFELANTGKAAPDPQLNRAVQASRRFFDHFTRVADDYYGYRQDVDTDARPLYTAFEGDNTGVVDYVKHMFDVDTMVRRSDEFIADVAENVRKNLEKSFKRSYDRFKKTQHRLQTQLNLLEGGPEVLAREYEATVDSLATLRADPIYKAGTEQLKDLRKSMREAGAERAEIDEAAEAMREALGEEFVVLERAVRDAERYQRVLNQLEANAGKEYAKLRGDITKLEQQQMKQLDTLLRKGEQAAKALAKLDGKVLSAKEKKLLEQFEIATRRALKNEELLDRYFIDSPGKYDSQLIRFEKSQAREKAALERLKAYDTFDADLARRTVAEALEAAKARTQRLNAKRAVRAEKAEQRAKELTPEALAEARKKAKTKTQGELDGLESQFNEAWKARGNRGNVLDGEINFAVRAREDAHALFSKIKGEPNRIVGLNILGDRRGSELARGLNLPFEVKKKWLVRDMEAVIRAYGHSIFPDMELYRASGSTNGATWFEELARDIARQRDMVGRKTYASPEAKEKALARFEKEAEEARRDLGVMVERVRHQRGMPDNPNGLGYRAGRVAQNANVYRFMGMVVPSSIPDLARPMFYYGINKTMREAWLPYLNQMKNGPLPSREQARRLGIALDTYLHNRAHAYFDVTENYATSQTKAERMVEFLANKTGFIAMFDKWNVEQKLIATHLNMVELVHHADVLARMEAPEAEIDAARQFFVDAGIGSQWARVFHDQMNLPGGSNTVDGVRFPNTESWSDLEAERVFGAGLQKLANNMIITPGLDRPSWVDANTIGRLLAQFRSYSFTATNRILMSGLQEPNMLFLQGTSMAIGLGAMSYMTWALVRGDRAWENAKNGDLQHWVYEAVSRSGIMGILGEGQRIGEQIPALNDWAIFGGENRPTRRANSILGQVLGPSYDLSERLVSLVQGLDEPTLNTLHNARVAMVPYQNAHLIARIYDLMEDGIAAQGLLPERRGE